MNSMMPKRAALSALLCLLPSLFAFAPLAHAADWAHKQKIILDTTATGADLKQEAALVPVALRLHSGNFTFTDAKPDGSDVRFLAADGKTPLKFHLEQFDAPNELAVAWVQVPKLAANAKATGFEMEWGNPDAPAVADAKGTYDGNQIFVLHFSDKEGVRDATGNANHAREANAKPVFAGPMGGALEFTGSERVVLPASASLKIAAANGFTFTAWVKPAGAEGGKLLTIGNGSPSLSVTLVSGAPVVTLGTAQAKATTPLKPGLWQHLAVTAAAGKLSIYVDGKATGGGDFVLADVAGDAVLGEGFKGELDEATLAGTARSPAYIAALAVSQAAESPLLSVAEEGGGEGASYITILLGAVTVDGWVVIGILIVMFVISVVVMITKAQFLARTKKGNVEFLQRFKDSSAEMLMPGSPLAEAQAGDAALQHSGISRLYAIGLNEIGHRFASMQGRGAEPSLSGAALDSIRASLDAGLVRENQRLNSQVVLLTIAISGGPFLGLLGTVVGVMITFAAIAAAGDVNVNSIAPGIAAALVATVAGLAVAIPALFGYNWLASQIKNVAADMQVFADEFVTKAAELHSR
jgi:biopolymer transport protein ExbB